jgi:hypothetical protein
MAALRVLAQVSVHPIEQGGIDVGLGRVFARRVRPAAGPDSRPRLQHRSGSLDAGVRFCHHCLRQALAATRYFLQLAEQPRDVGDLLIDTSPSSRTPGSALGLSTGRRLSVIEASALELVDTQIDDSRSHEICIPCELNAQIVLLFNETRGIGPSRLAGLVNCDFLVILSRCLH